MIRIFLKLFQEAPATEVAAKLQREAESLALQHEAAAEHHKALATMYRQRAARLSRSATLIDISDRSAA